MFTRSIKELRELTADNANQQSRIDEAGTAVSAQADRTEADHRLAQTRECRGSRNSSCGRGREEDMDELRRFCPRWTVRSATCSSNARRSGMAASSTRVDDPLGTVLCLVLVSAPASASPVDSRPDWRGSSQRAELFGGAPGRGQPASQRAPRSGDGDDRNHDDDQRAAGDLAANRRERAARRSRGLGDISAARIR